MGRGEPGAPAPRAIGIIGCSAEGAALCYRTIVSMAGARLGGHRHPEITMHTPSLQRYVERLDDGDLAGVGELMVSSANVLTRAGAEILICPDNTIHQALDHVLPHLSVPFLSIADVVAKAAKARGAEVVGIMGTQWLVESDVYPSALMRDGIACVRPNPDDIDAVRALSWTNWCLVRSRPRRLKPWCRWWSDWRFRGATRSLWSAPSFRLF